MPFSLARNLPSPASGWILSWIASAGLAADALVMLVSPQTPGDALRHIGYPAGHLPFLALILAIGIVAFNTRRFALAGLALLSGFLGGAIAMHVRIGEVVAPPVLISLTLGALLWAGLALRMRARSVA